MIKKKKKFPSELRIDLVSNDWVVIATGRRVKPTSFAKRVEPKVSISPKTCPFCKNKILKKAVSIHRNSNNNWFVLSMPNDFPAFSKGSSLNKRKEGPNRIMNGLGYQEVVITADHDRQMAQFSQEELKMVIDIYQERYLELANKKFIKYVSIFHNQGQEAGASIVHPHSQIVAIPVIDPDLRGSLDGAEAFYKKHKKCVYCTMINWDIKDGQRIIYQNKKFVALCPFAPQASFELRIYPKEHQSNFEKISERDKWFFADALQKTLSKLYKGLKDPAYNFYFHTAPCDKRNYNHYHWHLNILPRTAIWAGFELSAGIEISTIAPETAAKFLRKIK